MHSFIYRGFNSGPPLDWKPVWILSTALAVAVICLMMVYGIAFPPVV